MWWWELLILEVMGHAGSLERCSISLYFQNIIKKPTNLSLWLGRCLLHKMCIFRGAQALSPLWGSQSPVQGQLSSGSWLCSEEQPPRLAELLAVIQWPEMFNRQNPALNIGKLWFLLLYSELSYPIFSTWLFPLICPFLSHFFTGSQSEFLINLLSPFPLFPVRHFPVNPSLNLMKPYCVFFYFLNFVGYSLLS